MALLERVSRLIRANLNVLVDKAEQLVKTIAQPSLVQLVMRVALAVPFWKSGILKWSGLRTCVVECSVLMLRQLPTPIP